MDEKPKTDDWSDFGGQYIKADVIVNWPAIYVPTSLETAFDAEGKAILTYTGELEGKKKLWQPNKTNIDLLKANNIKAPSAAIGHKIFFKKVMNRNPATKQLVPGLEIEKIE